MAPAAFAVRHWPERLYLLLIHSLASTLTQLLQSLPPLLPEQPKVLILGSMPGAASLRAGQYYAHPRNAFWPILMRLLRQEQPLGYAARTALLRQAGLGLWDVLASCRRRGSLDQAIEPGSEVANDIASLLRPGGSLKAVACNGQKAHQAFRRHILPQLNSRAHFALLSLPSTSPAHAAMTFERKAQIWGQTLLKFRGLYI